MSTTPKLIKLASSDVIYMNQAFLKFIKGELAKPFGEVIKDDVIYFSKSADFKRGLLDVSEHELKRCIKMSKATCFMVNPNINLPVHGVGLINNKVSSNYPLEMSEDVLYAVSGYGADYLTEIKQWYEYFTLAEKPKLISDKSAVQYINSGIVINDDNLESVLELLEGDTKLAAQFIDTCDISQSLPHVLYLIYFRNGFNNIDYRLQGNLQSVRTYIRSQGSDGKICSKHLKEVMSVESLRDRITADYMETLISHINNFSGRGQEFVGDITVDFKWKDL